MSEINTTIDRVRRLTRNSDILAVCDEAVRLQHRVKALEVDLLKASRRVSHDRNAYMADYMRNYRKGKTKKGKR